MNDLLRVAMEQLGDELARRKVELERELLDEVIATATELLDARIEGVRDLAAKAGGKGRGGPFMDDNACARMRKLTEGEDTVARPEQIEFAYVAMFLGMAVAQIKGA